MIPLSLLLVLASLGLLTAGLADSSQALVWGSLLASSAACGCLLLSVLRRRRVLTATRRRAPRPPVSGTGAGPAPAR